MPLLRRLAAVWVVSCLALEASAEYSAKTTTALAAVEARFADQQFNVWSNAEGDLNGDCIEDMALVVTSENHEGSHTERLVVLTGNPDGSYSVLTASREFSNVVKFFNLSIERKSLFVQGVFHADAAGSSSYTLQFRHNAKLNDLEVIEKEALSEEFDADRSYRLSVNYLANTVVHSRKDGKRHKEIKGRGKASPLGKLQDFDGSAPDDPGQPKLYINEDFSVAK